MVRGLPAKQEQLAFTVVAAIGGLQAPCAERLQAEQELSKAGWKRLEADVPATLWTPSPQRCPLFPASRRKQVV